MNTLGLVFMLYIVGALLAGAVGAGKLFRNSPGTAGTSRTKGHLWLSPLYLLLLVGIGSSAWDYYTDLTYYRPVRADLVGHYFSEMDKGTDYIASQVFLTLNSDSTYTLAGDLLKPSQGTWAMPDQELPPLEPALVLSNNKDLFHRVVVIREARKFHLGVQGSDPDDTSVLVLKKAKYNLGEVLK